MAAISNILEAQSLDRVYDFISLGHIIFVVAQLVKNLPAMQETWVQSLGWEDPWRREWLPTPVFLPAEFHGQRSLECGSSWGRKKSDTTEQLSTHTHTHTHTHTLCHNSSSGTKGSLSAHFHFSLDKSSVTFLA